MFCNVFILLLQDDIIIKTIYQTYINRQEKINKEEIERKLEEKYKKHEEELKKMSEDLTKSLERKNGNTLSEEETNEIKRVFEK